MKKAWLDRPYHWGVFFLVLVLVGGYSYFVEPYWIEVSRHTIEDERVKEVFKIALLSDLHIHEIGSREASIREILSIEKPDLILVSGDAVAENARYREVAEFLASIKAKEGVWAVHGNWEHWRPATSELDRDAYESIQWLDNTNLALDAGIVITGVDDSVAGKPAISDLTESDGKTKAAFRVGFFHSPAYFDAFGDRFDLVLAGHTHGGQIRIPGIGALWLPHGSGRFESGWYQGQAASKMLVSRGLGTSILPLRFMCRPELPIVTLVPKTSFDK